MNLLCTTCGQVHESLAEKAACAKEHGGMRQTHRWHGARMGADVAEYLGEGLYYGPRTKLREPLPNEELDLEPAA